MAMAATTAEVLKPSAEKTNYIRLVRLLMCGGTKIVRGVFDSKIPPSQLPTKVLQLKEISFSPPQWKVLSGICVKSESFDITLLIKLLIKFCRLPAPPKGWNDLPDDKDLSLSDDLARIKYYRNELCHAKENLGISDGDFTTYWKRIKDALLRMVKSFPSLGSTKDWEDEIDKLLIGSITDEVDELKSLYLQDMEIKAILNKIVKELESMQPTKQSLNNCSGDRLVKFLKKYYSKPEWSLILPFPWMEGDRFLITNLYTSLTITEKGHTGEIEVANLFSPRKGGQETAVTRILIEGEAGIGKSTYCKKIAYDWSRGKLEIPDVDLVLLIKCCDLKDGDLWQAIKEQNLPEDLHGTKKAEEVFDYVRVNQQRILLILDGFDEIPATTGTTMKQSIKELVTGQLLMDARVILTSRPERCSDIRKSFDKKLEMTGFSWNDSRDFIKRFCSSPNNAAETISSLEKTAAIRELTRCPLNAAFLCLVLEEKKDDSDFFKSLDIGSLYREMVFCVIKRYCVEKKGQEVQDDTLMDEYHEPQVALGKIAFNLMKDNLTKFEEEKMPEDSKQVLKDIGFLIENKKLNTSKPKSTYFFSHSSIKEYFAALYVAECLKKGNIDTLTSIHKFTENPSSTGIGNSNHVQNVYYSLQRFNLAKMVKLSSNEDYIKLINDLASRLPNNIDVSRAEHIRFDFIFSFICEILGNCKGDEVTKVITEIAIPYLPLVLYLYNGRQALDGFISLLSQSQEESSKVRFKVLRLEGFQAVSPPSIPIEHFIAFSQFLGKHRFLKTIYLSFFSNLTDFTLFLENFQSTSVENLSLPYIPQNSSSKDSNIFTILRSLPNLISLDLSYSSIANDPQFYNPEGQSTNTTALRVLKLCHCNLSPIDVRSILRSLRTITTLTELNLSGNNFSDGVSFDLEGSTLQVLRMSNCNLRPNNVDSIFRSLRPITTLTEIDLSGNDLSDGVSFDLEGSPILKLWMSNCKLRTRDCNRILRSMSNKDVIKIFDMS